MSPFSLVGKHIVISGASSGIGRQCAISCADMGAKVSLLGRNIERLNDTLNHMKGIHKAYVVDLSIEQDVKDTVDSIVGDNGKIDGLLNVAGVSSTLLLKSMTGKRVEELFSNNVYSAIYLTKEVARPNRFSVDGGSIVFISSIMGTFGEIGKTLYGMTKGALDSGVKSLSCELSRRNIRVNSISPGAIITPINENMPHIADPEKRAELENKHLLGLGKTTDIANACIYLLSDASRWVTGINLFVDGGYSAK